MTAVVLLTCFVALLSAQQQAFAAEKPHEKKHDVKRHVEALEEQWRKAQLAGDVVTMDKMLADDFIGISMSGQVNTKAQQLERVKTRKLVLTRVDLSDMKVKLVGSVAIVTSQAAVEGTNDSEQMHGLFRYTRIYQRLPNGDWKITSFEATRIHSDKSGGEKKAGPAAPSSSGLRGDAKPGLGR
ncbi:MAG: nuclear transport factor 2 family protein [Edaphobacter sp.]|uniref:nuclear transport factor 2 family protein n=1 Tax=Edaphobacter sp. TaxID=1934404 RepID=UPI002388709A|nr:nuclear transport factor 2 family protein [Edaphobacter sp.]MDE1178027.1 nuclear transport factor 2 family protein [Edaphobacter sp.]